MHIKLSLTRIVGTACLAAGLFTAAPIAAGIATAHEPSDATLSAATDAGHNAVQHQSVRPMHVGPADDVWDIQG